MKAMKCVALALMAFGVAFTTGCDRHSNKEVFYMISSNMALPYWQTAAKGFNKAATWAVQGHRESGGSLRTSRSAG